MKKDFEDVQLKDGELYQFVVEIDDDPEFGITGIWVVLFGNECRLRRGTGLASTAQANDIFLTVKHYDEIVDAIAKLMRAEAKVGDDDPVQSIDERIRFTTADLLAYAKASVVVPR